MSSTPLVLASASPRRRELLRGAGFAPRVLESDLDDADLPRRGVTPQCFVASLAWFKAARVVRMHAPGAAVVLAADTVCIGVDRLLGKPRDERDARAMIASLRTATHRTATGVAVIEPCGKRHLFVDVATVTMGAIDDATLERYLASGAWRGKAGGYNYAECLASGWPLLCAGDPTSVMGLPMQRVAPLLDSLRVVRAEAYRC
ncbi:MAG: Maf family protein [Phycisphaerales bacterium]